MRMSEGPFVVLCVDDEQDVRDGLRMVLETAGYVFEEAATGEEGLDKCEEVKPDFVLADMMMESIDAGLNMAKAIRGKTDVPIYLLSSMGDGLNEQVNPAEFGLDGALQKPVDPVVLLGILKQRLG